MLNHIDEASDAIANIRDDWDRIVQDYNAYRAVLIEAGVPMHLDDEGKPTIVGARERDLIDGLLALAERSKQAEQAAKHFCHAVPTQCPITGIGYGMFAEHPEQGAMALYDSRDGGFVSIPKAVVTEKELPIHERMMVRLRHDPKTGEWSEEPVFLRLIQTDTLDAFQCSIVEFARLKIQVSQLQAAVAQERTDLAEQLAESRRREQLAVDQARKAEIECRRLEDLAKAMQRDRDQIRKSFNSTNDDFGELIVAAGDLVKECESCRAPWSRPRRSIVARVAPLVFSRRNGDGAS